MWITNEANSDHGPVWYVRDYLDDESSCFGYMCADQEDADCLVDMLNELEERRAKDNV